MSKQLRGLIILFLLAVVNGVMIWIGMRNRKREKKEE